MTIFISTHFMNEAEPLRSYLLMHAGKVLASDTPPASWSTARFKQPGRAFIAYGKRPRPSSPVPEEPSVCCGIAFRTYGSRGRRFSLRRLFSYSRREALELRRDPVRSTLALLGTVILMFIMGYADQHGR